jgi:hypothetical protein
MTDQPLREPEQIRSECARKLRSVETGGMFTAILGCLLGEDWAMPSIEELRLTPDKCRWGELPARRALRRSWVPRPI